MTIAKLKKRVAAPPQHDFSGLWRTIEWQPDLFNPQKFIVGIALESSEGETAFRLMEKAGRFECFFRPEPMAQEFNWLLSTARRDIAAGKPISCHNLSLSDGLFINGTSIDAVAAELFEEIVIAARPTPENSKAEEIGPDTSSVRRSVNDELKRIMSLDFERVSREHGHTLSNHHLDVTLAPTGGCGSVISTCYRTPASIEIHLLRAAQDISAYATAQNCPSKAIFLRVPDQNAPLNARERRAIETLTGEACWKLECAGFKAPRHEVAATLATEIRDWAMPLLQAA